MATGIALGAALSLSIAVLPAAQARGSGQASDIQTVQLAALPPQAQATMRLISAGGPFPYAKDGSVFGNRERDLPREPRGFYREYTVKVSQAHNRGALRIVCGGTPPAHPEACYYTSDHYASFQRIVQ